jgi:hypothetical protein
MADETNSVNLEDPKVQEAIRTLVEAQVAEKTAGLVKNKQELLEEAKNAKQALKSIKDKYGEDLSIFDKLMADEQKRKEAEMTLEERLEQRYAQEKKQLTDMWANERTKFETETKSKDAAIKKYLVDAELERIISAEGGKAHFLKPALAGQLQVIQENGEYKVRVMDRDVPRLTMDGSPMGITELVRAYKNDEAWGAAFNATGATGGGATGNNSSSASSGALSRSKMTVEQKTAKIAEVGLQAYLALPA